MARKAKSATRGSRTRRPKASPRRVARRDQSFPKTTRPEAMQRRQPEPSRTVAEKIGRRLDAVPDRIDVRDWFYQPRLVALPDVIVNCDAVPEILDQGAEGACTGFALAAVINFLLRSRKYERCVSPRMLYDMARRYDEWPGEEYEGSSARGAMKGWVMHGVAKVESWTTAMKGPQHLTPSLSAEARMTPGGAYYRVMHRQVRDMHAALNEVGILYATLMVHGGWDEPGPDKRKVQYIESGTMRDREFPVITRKGRADGGHAVAVVGYTNEGFIIQNSWGPTWGSGGFALLPYEDWLLHATDVWVAQLGVPVALDLWTVHGQADTSAGLQRASEAVPLDEIRPFVIDVGNNGELSTSGTYWTTADDLQRLFAEQIPDRTKGWAKRRVLLYLHGGLNSEREVARRIVAFRDVLLENEIYPLHVMWESGLGETLQGLLRDLFTDVDERAGAVADWLRKLRDGMVEAKDRTFELSAAAPGGRLWREMKENAKLASRHPAGRGGMQLLTEAAKRTLKDLTPADRSLWELHVVGHSAGAIFTAFALPHLAKASVRFESLQLMAPAITVEAFKELMVPAISQKSCPPPTMYVLSDVGERDDQVWAYGKSLLYLVSNAFEGKRETPLLGMERFVSEEAAEGKQFVDSELNAMFKQKVNGFPRLVVAGRAEGPASTSRSETHGGFDNDPETMNSVLWRILGKKPDRPFTTRDLQL
jgi:Papain family cysteine protease